MEAVAVTECDSSPLFLDRSSIVGLGLEAAGNRASRCAAVDLDLANGNKTGLWQCKLPSPHSPTHLKKPPQRRRPSRRPQTRVPNARPPRRPLPPTPFPRQQPRQLLRQMRTLRPRPPVVRFHPRRLQGRRHLDHPHRPCLQAPHATSSPRLLQRHATLRPQPRQVHFLRRPTLISCGEFGAATHGW